MVYPLYMRLPMGLSHSVHILMCISTAAVGRAIHASARLQHLDPVDMLLEDLQREYDQRNNSDTDELDHHGLRAARRGEAQFTPQQWKDTFTG